MEDINYPGAEIPISKPVCVDDACPCHSAEKKHIHPSEQSAQCWECLSAKLVSHPTTEKNINDTGYAGLDDFSTTDTSDWRERFRKLFSCECMLCQEKEYPFETTRLTMEAFIEKEIEKAREEAGIFWLQHGLNQGQQAEQTRIIALAEEEFNNSTSATVQVVWRTLITKIKK